MVIETKIDSIEKQNQDQYNILSKIEGKLDSVIECKADKTEVDMLRTKVNTITWQVMTGLIIALVTVVGFLLRYTLFK